MNHYDKIKTAEQDIVNRTASYNIAHWIVRPLINSLDKIAKEVLTDQEFQEYLKEMRKRSKRKSINHKSN